MLVMQMPAPRTRRNADLRMVGVIVFGIFLIASLVRLYNTGSPYAAFFSVGSAIGVIGNLYWFFHLKRENEADTEESPYSREVDWD